MRDDFEITLEAVAPRLRCARRYQVRVVRDLFGHFLIELAWGRIGTAGQAQLLSAPTQTSARGVLRERLRRRASLPQRLGADYRVKHVAGDAAWLVDAGFARMMREGRVS